MQTEAYWPLGLKDGEICARAGGSPGDLSSAGQPLESAMKCYENIGLLI